jgi:hypothetical protein
MTNKNSQTFKRKIISKKKKKNQNKNLFLEEIKLINKKHKREIEVSTNSESNLTSKNENIKFKKIKRKKEKFLQNEFKKCPSCNWLFPKEISFQRINVHINKCLDGSGEKDKKIYENYTKYNQINICDTNKYKSCPICNKVIYQLSDKVKYFHIKECLEKFEKRD